MRKQHFLAALRADQGKPFAAGQRGFQRIRQAGHDVGPHNQAVDHDFDGVLFLLVQSRRIAQLIHLPVDAHADKAAFLQVFQELGVFALAPAHQRRHQGQARSLGQRENLVDHLVDRLLADFSAAFGTMRHAHPGVEQAQIIVDFRDRSHGGAGIAAGRFLVDGDGRRQPFDDVHVRLFHLSQELARIGGKRLDVAALAFGVNGVKGKGRFSAAGNAGKDHQLAARDFHVDVLQVVFPGSPDNQHVFQRSDASA